jgi:hypothetical protein
VLKKEFGFGAHAVGFFNRQTSEGHFLQILHASHFLSNTMHPADFLAP